MENKRRTKNEMWKRIVGMMLAFAMVLSGLPIVGNNTSFDVYGEEVSEENIDGIEDVDNADGITVVFHFTNIDNFYQDYNMWLWTIGDGFGKDMVDNGTEATCTVEVESTTTSLGYIIKRGEDWELKDYDSERFIDLSEIISGQVDVYVQSGVGAVTVDTTNAVMGVKMISAKSEDLKSVIVSITGEVERPSELFEIWNVTEGTIVPVSTIQCDSSYTNIYEYKFNVDVELDINCSYEVVLGESRITVEITYSEVIEEFTSEDCYNSKVYYTLAGGCSNIVWNPLAKANQMTETIWDGVYSIKIDVPAYDEAAEWNNRFRICKIDYNTVSLGWNGSICLGTTVADDNQTTFRIENEEALTSVTVFFDSNTGAVVMYDEFSEEVDYKFSWVGYEAEAGYTDVENFSTCGITWPHDKINVAQIPDIKNGYNKLVSKLRGQDLADESLYEDGSVKYVVTGGCSPIPWGTTSSANEMKESHIEGVYEFKMDVKAFDEFAEWNNRFKILRLDDLTCANGWLGSLCLGTDAYYDNQTWFRIESDVDVELTVYFEPATGAVVMLDSDGKEVNYRFSWVGFDSEVQYTTVSAFATCGYTWPQDKMYVDEIPDIEEGYNALAEKILFDEKDNYFVTYHFYNAKGWDNVGAWVRQGIDWAENALPRDKCVLKVTTDGSRPSEPLWPGAKMEAEGGGWYKITCSYSAPEKGSMMIFNNYVGDSTPGDTTSEADIQNLRDAGVVLNDVAVKEQTQNIMIKKNEITSNEYWINWDGNSNGSQIILGKSGMITDTAPVNYKPNFKCGLTVNGSSEEQAVLKDEYVILEPNVGNSTGEYTYKYVMEDVLTGEIKVLKNFSTSPMYIYKISTLGTKKFTVYVKDEDGMIFESNTVSVIVGGLVGNLMVNRNLSGMKLVVGDYVLLEASATGGSGAYTYKYVMEDVSTGVTEILKDYSTSSRHFAMIDSVGRKNLKVYIKDSSGTEFVTNTVTVEVEEALSVVLKVNDSTNKVTTKEGKVITLNTEVNGGEPIYTYKFEELNVETKETTLLSDFSENSVYEYVTKGEGTYYIMVTVEDALGNMAEAVIQVCIYPTGWKNDGNNTYYLDDNGIEVTGWKQIEGNWYYFDTNGVMQTSRWIDNKYYVKADGTMAISEIVEGKYYVEATGLCSKVTAWKEVDGNWYYFVKGIMQTSRWVGSKYYVKADGTMAKSEFVDNGNYYIGADGIWVSTTRWLQVDESWYYLKAGTVQKSKWVKVGSDYYYFDGNGVMQTSRWIAGKYYVKENGKMAVSEWVDGGKYYVGEDGIWVQGA